MRPEVDFFFATDTARLAARSAKAGFDMVQGANRLFSVLRPFAAAGLVLGLAAGFSLNANAQGGQTEVMKSKPAPAPAPAPAEQPAAAESEAAPAPDAAQEAEAPASGAPAETAEPTSPVGSGSAWEADVAATPENAAPETSDPAALEVVQKANEYFNGLTTLQGDFLQTDPDNKQKRGKFYFQRPGKVRFEYAPPSRLVIVSNGEYLAIEDSDLQTTDRYPLEMTPFRLLLSANVDLIQDARILAVDMGPDTVVLTLEDQKGDSPGRLRLFFNREDMTLKQWIITDPQGLDTRVELANLENGKEVAAKLFEFNKTLGFKNLSQ